MKRIPLILLSVLLMFACDKNINENDENNSNNPSTVLEKILSMGFLAQDIEEFDDYYVVEGDILFYKKENISDYSITRQQAQSPEVAYLEKYIYIC